MPMCFTDEDEFEKLLSRAHSRSLQHQADWKAVIDLFSNNDLAAVEVLLWLLTEIKAEERRAFFKDVKDCSQHVVHIKA